MDGFQRLSYRVMDVTGNPSPRVSQLEHAHVLLVNLEHPRGKWLLFVLRKESRIGIMFAVWAEVLVGFMQSELGRPEWDALRG